MRCCFFQSLFIALGCILLALIGRHKGLNNQQIAAVLLPYALYPVVINITLFDFHPDVLAVPLFFILFLTFELKNVVFFCASLLAIASTKAVLSLTLMSYGLAILLLKNEKKFGLIALGFGVFGMYLLQNILLIYSVRGALRLIVMQVTSKVLAQAPLKSC